ncbi:MAG: c-type cytochrome [Betaproteobacteria bacterium]
MTGSQQRSRNAALAAQAAAAAFFFVLGAGHAPAADPEPAKSQACTACHGPGGRSQDPNVPALAGQPRQFIETQLVMYREGNRKNPAMSPFAASLTNAELRELASYFSAQKAAPPGRTVSADVAASGKRISDTYNCTSCHGPALLGQQHIPRLAGQQAEYLRTQLRGFKASTRFDMDGQMTSAAQALSAGDIDTLADYLASLGGP